MVRTLILVSILLNCGLPISVSQAQLLRGNAAPPAAREPARTGLLGGLWEAREERFRREEQAATAAAAQRNAAANPRANADASAQQSAGVANNLLRRDSTGRSQVGAGLANSKASASNSLLRSTPVTPASATAFVPEPVGYDGPGVAIRLPRDARSVVNYLVDDVEANAIRPGEQQVLDVKGSYVVRYSRGVTPDGRSFGESRYTITEGRYRFELTATGWELYREPVTDVNLAPPNRLDLADRPLNDRQYSDVLLPEPSSQSELQRILPSQSAGKPEVTPSEAKEIVGNEEVLPAPKPRSILE